MAIFFDFSKDRNISSEPDRLAFEANDIAIRAADARKSRESLEMSIQEEMNHPAQREFIEHSRSRRNLLWIILSAAFLMTIAFEWQVSREIYRMLFPWIPWLPLACCVAVGFYCSACLGEGWTQSSSNNIEDMYINALYDRPKKKAPWLLHPIIGLLIGFLFLTGIYLASKERVKLLEMAGEILPTSFQVFLPVVLYAAEIILGVFFYLFLKWIYCFLRIRKLRKSLSRARDHELVLRQRAVQCFMTYFNQLEKNNFLSENQGNSLRTLIPPNENLRQLLIEEFGHDPTSHNQQPPSNGQWSSPPSYGKSESPYTEEIESPNSNAKIANENLDDHRVEDLTALLDEQISKFNRSL